MSDNQNNSSLQPEFTIQRIYVKDMSLEVLCFPQEKQLENPPSIKLDLNFEAVSLKEVGHHEVVLSINVKIATQLEDKNFIVIEVKQAGLFVLKGFTEAENERILEINCPTILFPYVREAVSDLMARASFPPFYLAPVNFEGIYVQKKQGQEVKSNSVRKNEDSQSSLLD